MWNLVGSLQQTNPNKRKIYRLPRSAAEIARGGGEEEGRRRGGGGGGGSLDVDLKIRQKVIWFLKLDTLKLAFHFRLRLIRTVQGQRQT